MAEMITLGQRTLILANVVKATNEHCHHTFHRVQHDYTAKSYVLNQNWNQSDPDLYPETQRNFLATGLIPNCKSDLYQFCSSVSVQYGGPVVHSDVASAAGPPVFRIMSAMFPQSFHTISAASPQCYRLEA